jgi:transaldolase/glucose-6-phosphate isomerase
MKFFTDARNAGQLGVDMLRSHLNRLGAGDYFALLGYIHTNPEHEAILQRMRLSVRDNKRGTTCDDAHDLPIRGQKFTFGTVKAAHARGDFDVLADRQRRALRVHLRADLKTGLATLEAAIMEALN